ncbi:hypothetical protein LTR97_004779 [Elasticomyces elasticus]|uniref:DUF6594 domain-containing protein n=1 Tax=Elasticomyces elasticus TaxID=574655 RepID=A0AAN7W7A0_9PEZI|nr:hypothetical protein LTR97_004779 [Elasticomyces elasticus]
MEAESTRDSLSGNSGARQVPDQLVDQKHTVSVSASTARPSTYKEPSHEIMTPARAQRPTVSLDRSIKAECSGGEEVRPELKPYEESRTDTEYRTAVVGPPNSSDIEKIPETVTDADVDSESGTSTSAHSARLVQRASLSSPSPQEAEARDRPNPPLPMHTSKPWDQAFQDGLNTPPRQTSVVDDMTEETQMRQLFDAGKLVVFDTTHSRRDQNAPKTSTLNLAALQQMNLHYLQYRIASHVGRSFDEGTFVAHLELEEPALPNEYRLDFWMERYCQAVRDMDYMKERATLNPAEDPFKMMSSRAVERSIMETVGLIPKHLIPAGILPNALDHDRPALHINSRVKAKKEAAREQNFQRLAMAAVGGLLLLVPVLIMANLPGKLATLVTTSASMVVFAVLVTLGTDLGPNEVLATTAGYAAVLVVFVGTSLAPQAGNSR